MLHSISILHGPSYLVVPTFNQPYVPDAPFCLLYCPICSLCSICSSSLSKDTGAAALYHPCSFFLSKLLSLEACIIAIALGTGIFQFALPSIAIHLSIRPSTHIPNILVRNELQPAGEIGTSTRPIHLTSIPTSIQTAKDQYSITGGTTVCTIYYIPTKLNFPTLFYFIYLGIYIYQTMRYYATISSFFSSYNKTYYSFISYSSSSPIFSFFYPNFPLISNHHRRYITLFQSALSHFKVPLTTTTPFSVLGYHSASFKPTTHHSHHLDPNC